MIPTDTENGSPYGEIWVAREVFSIEFTGWVFYSSAGFFRTQFRVVKMGSWMSGSWRTIQTPNGEPPSAAALAPEDVSWRF